MMKESRKKIGFEISIDGSVFLEKEHWCQNCNFIKLEGHKCKSELLKEIGLMPEILYCEDHSPDITFSRVHNFKDPTNYLTVYFETLKCK